MKNSIKVELQDVKLQPILNEVGKVTCGPGEGAAVCLMLFVQLWQHFQDENQLSLDEIAEDARRMIMSYETDTLQ